MHQHCGPIDSMVLPVYYLYTWVIGTSSRSNTGTLLSAFSLLHDSFEDSLPSTGLEIFLHVALDDLSNTLSLLIFTGSPENLYLHRTSELCRVSSYSYYFAINGTISLKKQADGSRNPLRYMPYYYQPLSIFLLGCYCIWVGHICFFLTK